MDARETVNGICAAAESIYRTQGIRCPKKRSDVLYWLKRIDVYKMKGKPIFLLKVKGVDYVIKSRKNFDKVFIDSPDWIEVKSVGKIKALRKK